ncbi:MAG: TIGR02757 family protein [Myxococcota bacterium]
MKAALRRASAPSPELREQLDGLRRRMDAAAVLSADPLGLVHRYSEPEDQEVVGLLVAGLAYGRASVIRERAGDLLERLGPTPSRSIGVPRVRRRLRGFVYRFQRGDDLERFTDGLHRYRRKHGSLARGFLAGLDGAASDLTSAMTRFVEGIRREISGPASYGLGYLLPSPERGGAAKRLALYLRWMIRPADGIDLGTWQASDLTSRLIMPLDTHVARIGRALGLTERVTPDLRTALEITRALRELCPDDPLRYDMPLCHMGISGMCPSRRVEAICRECGIRSVCRLGFRA